MQKLSVGDALRSLGERQVDFARFVEKETFDVSLYKPEKIDLQTPHARDEVYVIASGSGKFICDGEMETVAAGDMLFVAAGTAHRFLDFTEDFSAWVVFFGPRPVRPAD